MIKFWFCILLIATLGSLSVGSHASDKPVIEPIDAQHVYEAILPWDDQPSGDISFHSIDWSLNPKGFEYIIEVKPITRLIGHNLAFYSQTRAPPQIQFA